MPLTLEQIIWLLNLDLSWEYAALIQYIQHAAMLTGPEYVAVMDEELQHAQQEHDHAVQLSDQIQYLGGVPTVQVQQTLTSLDNVEMLRQDLQA
ncbi:MAG TPA: ferritin-like domain-containing protein, partial [Firmicutes bacterium]|nr:ferritin-like domain-containing protein [Bacillota bacterium]